MYSFQGGQNRKYKLFDRSRGQECEARAWIYSVVAANYDQADQTIWL